MPFPYIEVFEKLMKWGRTLSQSPQLQKSAHGKCVPDGWWNAIVRIGIIRTRPQCDVGVVEDFDTVAYLGKCQHKVSQVISRRYLPRTPLNTLINACSMIVFFYFCPKIFPQVPVLPKSVSNCAILAAMIARDLIMFAWVLKLAGACVSLSERKASMRCLD